MSSAKPDCHKGGSVLAGMIAGLVLVAILVVATKKTSCLFSGSGSSSSSGGNCGGGNGGGLNTAAARTTIPLQTTATQPLLAVASPVPASANAFQLISPNGQWFVRLVDGLLMISKTDGSQLRHLTPPMQWTGLFAGGDVATFYYPGTDLSSVAARMTAKQFDGGNLVAWHADVYSPGAGVMQAQVTNAGQFQIVLVPTNPASPSELVYANPIAPAFSVPVGTVQQVHLTDPYDQRVIVTGNGMLQMGLLRNSGATFFAIEGPGWQKLKVGVTGLILNGADGSILTLPDQKVLFRPAKAPTAGGGPVSWTLAPGTSLPSMYSMNLDYSPGVQLVAFQGITPLGSTTVQTLPGLV